jgi:cell division protein FtsB
VPDPSPFAIEAAYLSCRTTARFFNDPHLRRVRQEEDTAKEVVVMTRRILAVLLGLALAVVLVPRISIAEENHIAEAISHTKMAIDEGKQGKADQVVVHAKVALTHAEAAEKAKPNTHTTQGIEHLKQAIATGKKGQAAEATQHAEVALEHLDKAE